MFLQDKEIVLDQQETTKTTCITFNPLNIVGQW